jgi:hypothetical protein
MVTGVASEILDRSKSAEDHVWAAALDEVLAAPAPAVRSLPRMIAGALRRHVGAAAQLRPTLDHPAGETPYTRALLALLSAPLPEAEIMSTRAPR